MHIVNVSKNNQVYEILMRPQIGHFKVVPWRWFIDRLYMVSLLLFCGRSDLSDIGRRKGEVEEEEAGFKKEHPAKAPRIRAAVFGCDDTRKKPHKGQSQWARALTSQFTLDRLSSLSSSSSTFLFCATLLFIYSLFFFKNYCIPKNCNSSFSTI